MKNNNKFSYLIGRPSPRDIPEVHQQRLKYDMVIAKDYQHWYAMQQIRNYFLNHNYDYLIIAPDDLVVKQEHLNQLIEDCEKIEYKAISGMCNVDEHDHIRPDGNLNISMELPSKQKPRKYNWLTKDIVADYIDDIFPVKFAGFPLMAIRRDLIMEYEFPSDSIFKKSRPQEGYSFDLVFCYWCQDKGIPIYVDRRIYIEHKRNSGINHVGQREPRTYFISAESRPIS